MKQSTPQNVDAYISDFPEAVQERLQKLRATIKKAAPGAEELISYKMPAYKLDGVLVYFAGYKNHIGLYATPAAHSKFEIELAAYKIGKGSVQFPLDKPMPYPLITKIVQYKAQLNAAAKKVKKK